MDKTEISDIVCAAEIYLKKLQNLDENIKRAEKQIVVSGNESLANIETMFENLKDTVLKSLDLRKLQLIDDVKKVQNDGIKPLCECQNVIAEKIKTTNNLINQGNKLLQNSFLPSNSTHFYTQSNLIGNLPAVPSLVEVPYINFTYAKNVQQEIADSFKNIGSLFFHSPVNIHSLIPKPGSILIQWEENDSVDDRLTNIHEFRLQFAFGDVLQNPDMPLNFHDCYIGPNTEYLKKDLKLNQSYSFRVCCKIDESVEWSPWSLPQIAQTSIKPFSWNITQKDFSLNNDDKLATKVTKDPALLISCGPQFQPNYSIEFTVLEMDDNSCFNSIGLCDQDDIKLLSVNNHSNINTFSVSSNGRLYVGGKKKSTKLPSFKKGSKISFTCEEVNDKVRIYVESEEKNVTYDWKIGNNEGIYFFVLAESPIFKVLVE